jgi:Protein of unknown function (DUF3572)
VKPSSPSIEESSIIALKLIGFIASDETRSERFSALTGLTPQDLHEGATKPEFLGFVLEYALQDESLILEFAAMENIKPQSLIAARHVLPGATYDF